MIIVVPDQKHLARTQNTSYRQAEILPSEPILIPEYHWEGCRTNLYGSVFKSRHGYEMYYQCGNALRIGYAQSEDGLRWRKPLVNVADFSANPQQVIQANNAISPSEVPMVGEGQELTNLVAGYHMPSILYEPESQSACYKIFAFGEQGYHILRSANGKQFEEYPENPAIELLSYKNDHTNKTWFSDVSPCFKDRRGYTAMVKTYHVDGEQRTRRCVGRATSGDFLQWGEVSTIWQPGAAEDQIAQSRGYRWADFYGLCPFFWGSGYLGYLWLFEIDHELPRGTNLGKIEVFLAYSADGVSWERLSDKPLIPWDLNFGAEGGMVTTPSAPVFDGDSIKLYYSDCNFEHGFAEKDFTKPVKAPTWVVRCAQVPKERLVGISSPNGEVEINAIPETIEKLRLNAECPDGAMEVVFLRQQEVVAAYTLKDVDSTDHWLNPSLTGVSSILLRLRNACLYALEIR